MNKTFKEKYLVMKKENQYLKLINETLEYDLNNCKLDFLNFKRELKDKNDKENKNFFIFSIIVISLLTVFAIISLFVG